MAVSDYPEGPFVDKGTPLVSAGSYTSQMIDPAVFVDDDGTGYLYWGNHHTIGKKNTQTIERKNLTIRARIKKLARKTICFSKSEKMHGIAIILKI